MKPARSCFCIGPQAGESLCPCAMRAESDKDRRLRELEAEVRRLKGSGRVLRDRVGYRLYERIGP